MTDIDEKIKDTKLEISRLEMERRIFYDIPISILEKTLRDLEWENRTEEEILKDNNYT